MSGSNTDLLRPIIAAKDVAEDEGGRSASDSRDGVRQLGRDATEHALFQREIVDAVGVLGSDATDNDGRSVC
jgi:hypothetical protein